MQMNMEEETSQGPEMKEIDTTAYEMQNFKEMDEEIDGEEMTHADDDMLIGEDDDMME